MNRLVLLLCLSVFFFGCSPGSGGGVASDGGPRSKPDAAQAATLTAAVVIGGQSNAVGHGPYSGVFPEYSAVTYSVNGISTHFGPNPIDLGAALGGMNTNGAELGVGPALLAKGYAKVAICKAAHDSYRIDQLTTGVSWTGTLACLDVVAHVGAPRLEYLWVQGEADVAAPTGYGAKLSGMFAALRAAADPVPVRFYVVLLNPSNVILGAVGCDSIRAQQRAAVDADPDAALIDADDLKTYLGSALDHYDSVQEIALGERMSGEVEQ